MSTMKTAIIIDIKWNKTTWEVILIVIMTTWVIHKSYHILLTRETLWEVCGFYELVPEVCTLVELI